MLWQVASAADRLEDFVRSNRSRSRDVADADRVVSMSESLLSPASGDTESLSAPLVSTRQKKSMSAPDVYLPRSLSQLEEDVSWPCGV